MAKRIHTSSRYFATLEGEVCIQVEEISAAEISNDLCTNATNLIIGGGCITNQNIAAGFDGPNPSCTIYSDADIWYQFVAPASGGIQLNTGANFEHSVGIYSGVCTDLTEYTCIANPISMRRLRFCRRVNARRNLLYANSFWGK